MSNSLHYKLTCSDKPTENDQQLCKYMELLANILAMKKTKRQNIRAVCLSACFRVTLLPVGQKSMHTALHIYFVIFMFVCKR